jgi:hypothetical protein
MNNTKKLWLLLLMQLLSLPLLAGHGKKLAWLHVVSQEKDSVTGYIDVQFCLKMYDSANVVRAFHATLPDT